MYALCLGESRKACEGWQETEIQMDRQTTDRHVDEQTPKGGVAVSPGGPRSVLLHSQMVWPQRCRGQCGVTWNGRGTVLLIKLEVQVPVPILHFSAKDGFDIASCEIR